MSWIGMGPSGSWLVGFQRYGCVYETAFAVSAERSMRWRIVEQVLLDCGSGIE